MFPSRDQYLNREVDSSIANLKTILTYWQHWRARLIAIGDDGAACEGCDLTKYQCELLLCDRQLEQIASSIEKFEKLRLA